MLTKTTSTTNFEIHVDVQQLTKQDCFNSLVVKAVDSVFTKLGNDSKQAIYRCLKGDFGIRTEDIPGNIDMFTKALEELFGSAAKLIEIDIIRLIHEWLPSFNYVPDDANIHFEDYIKKLNNHLCY